MALQLCMPLSLELSSGNQSMIKKLKIGTRGSPLAVAQADETVRRLVKAWPDRLRKEDLEIVIIKTSGDRIQDRSLSSIGGKGLFVKEIEEAMMAGHIDMAVHSMKDMETALPEGLLIDCLLPREDARDAFISAKGHKLADLPTGSLVGTSSLRRQAQILHHRPDLKVDIFRGVVETRLRKLADGVADATLLAYAGLRRLGKQDVVTELLETDRMLPAVAQGAIGIERRQGDDEIAELLGAINDPDTETRITAERAMLAVLDGSCRTPIAGHAVLDEDGNVSLSGAVYSPDGVQAFTSRQSAMRTDAAALGREVGHQIRQNAGEDFMASLGAS